MSSRLTVVYDACVLYPAPLWDLLLRLVLTDRFRARWSNAIHDEWIHNLLKQRPELDRATLEKTRALMDSNVRDSLVEGFEHLIPTIELPDLGNRHVVAAAIHSSADIIVTFNLKDFPSLTRASRSNLQKDITWRWLLVPVCPRRISFWPIQLVSLILTTEVEFG